MRPYLLLALLLTAALSPVKLYAQTKDGENSYGAFTYGDDVTKDKEEEKSKIWQYGQEYRKTPANYGKNAATNKTKVRLVPNYYYGAYFLRQPGMPSGEMVLRVFSAATLTGCITIKPPVIKTVRTGKVIDLKITEAEFTVDTTARYAHYQCGQGGRTAFADVVFDRDKLIRDGTKKILLKSDTAGRFSDVDLDINPSRAIITSTVPDLREMGIPMAGSTSTLTYWFYPENTIVLYAPRSPVGKDISAEIEAFAQKKNLVPLEKILPGFESNEKGEKSRFYYVDTSGALGRPAEGQENWIVGGLQQPRTFHGPDGPYEKPENIDIFASHPTIVD